MISCLLAVWFGSVTSQVLFERYLSPITAAHQQVFSTHLYDVVGTPSLILSLTLLVCCLIVTALWIRATLVGGTHRFQSLLNNAQENQGGSLWTDLFGLGLHLMLLCSVLLASASTGLAHCIVRDRDVAVLTAASHKTVVDARVRVLSPTMVSERRGFDCRNDIRVETITVSGVSAHSNAKARMYANRSDCRVQQQAVYQVHAQVEMATFGQSRVWLTLISEKRSGDANHSSGQNSRSNLVELSPANSISTMVTRMQDTFLRLTRRLDDQGKILVPGLTMGVMGQDPFISVQSDTNNDNDDIVPAYAAQLTRDCKQAGIMHLMAVSGGHFLLLGVFVRKICVCLRFPEWLKASLHITSIIALAGVMYPSDSVLRAQAMGLMAAVIPISGRRSQTISVLSWTAITVILFDPSMACSFGFALSCAAVLAISTCSQPLSIVFARHLPRTIAESLATTLMAQAATMPIQILMSPQVPLLSPLANLMVSPFVDFATVCGLLGLMTACCLPGLALVFVQLASLGTSVMAFTASWLGGSSVGSLPWPSGCVGALCAVVIELALILLMRMVLIQWRLRLLQKDSGWGREPVEMLTGRYGAPYNRSWWERLRQWWTQSWSLISSNRNG
ncbi:ComEC/Rec2 family competence protein [Bombiscardovia coagulans]|nr:ComEC/Rec2 family competence protein [Bombiscardovia coagulans]